MLLGNTLQKKHLADRIVGLTPGIFHTYRFMGVAFEVPVSGVGSGILGASKFQRIWADGTLLIHQQALFGLPEPRGPSWGTPMRFPDTPKLAAAIGRASEKNDPYKPSLPEGLVVSP